MSAFFNEAYLPSCVNGVCTESTLQKNNKVAVGLRQINHDSLLPLRCWIVNGSTTDLDDPNVLSFLIQHYFGCETATSRR